MEQREERHFVSRVCVPGGHACGRETGVFEVPHSDPGLHVRRGRPVDDHFRTAVIHVVLRRQNGDARRFEPDLKILAGACRQLTKVQQRWTRGGHENSRVPGLQFGKIAFAYRARDPDSAAFHGNRRRRAAAEGEQRNRFTVLFE